MDDPFEVDFPLKDKREFSPFKDIAPSSTDIRLPTRQMWADRSSMEGTRQLWCIWYVLLKYKYIQGKHFTLYVYQTLNFSVFYIFVPCDSQTIIAM